jgi:hypothetical protein
MMPHVENVQRSVGVPVVDRSAIAARPFSYPETFSTLWVAPCKGR